MQKKGIFRHSGNALLMMAFWLISTVAVAQTVSTQTIETDSATWTVKPRTNLLYWLSATPNIGADIAIGRNWSAGATYGYNPFTFSDGKKWKHVLAAAELRHWTDSVFKHRTSFWGLDATYSHFNAGMTRFPLGLYPSVRDLYKQGDLAAIGAFVGYNWRLNRLFRLETAAGLGVGYSWVKTHDCDHCYLGRDNKAFLMPKLAVNVVLDPMRRVKKTVQVIIPEPVDTQVVVPVELPQLTVAPVVSVGEELAVHHPVVQSYEENYRPYDKTRILRKEEGALYVHFPLDKTELIYGFRNNAETLDEIVSVTKQIMADTHSRVRLIQIIGLASIEGPQAHNQWLSDNRALALRDYVMSHVEGITENMFELNGGGEAWAEFRDQVNDLVLENNAQSALSQTELSEVLRIIDTVQNLDQRERRLKRLNGGKTYRRLLNTLLADQRNSGYLRIYFDRVPDRQAEAINRASTLLQQEQYGEALTILDGLREDPRSWNALGVALYMTGQKEEALGFFRRAANNGDRQAKENLERIKN